MRKNFHESYEHGEIELPSEKGTGLVFAGVATIIGLTLFYHSNYSHYTALVIALIIAAIFAFLALQAPSKLKRLNILWFKFSMLLYKIVNPVVMGLMFVIAIIPAGLLMRLWHDPLRAKKPTDVISYWIDKSTDSTPKSMKNQF